MSPAPPPTSATWLGQSPLRWPGAKRRLLPQIAPLVGRREQLIEPFAGGASVSLALLHTGQVHRAVLGDADPDVHAFWRTATTDADWLIDAFAAAEVTVEAFLALRSSTPTSTRERALRLLVLNRTSFSGIVHPRSGPLGGLEQAGATRIDSRLARERVLRQLRWIGMLGASGRLRVADGPWHAVADATEGMLYLDPPYVERADLLYTTAFSAADHLELAAYLHDSDRPWVLSYDDHPLIRSLYAGFDVTAPQHAYSVSGRRATAQAGRELLVTNRTRARQRTGEGDDPRTAGGGRSRPMVDTNVAAQSRA